MRMRKKQSTYFEGKKVILALLLTCIFVMGSGFSVNAAESTGKNYSTDRQIAINLSNHEVDSSLENSQVTDQAGLLSQSEIEEIESQIEKMEEKTGWDVMAVTTDDAEGMDATYYAEKWFDDYTTCDDGIIFFVDMDNRELIMRTFGEAIDCINDAKRDNILDAGYEKVSDE